MITTTNPPQMIKYQHLGLRHSMAKEDWQASVSYHDMRFTIEELLFFI